MRLTKSMWTAAAACCVVILASNMAQAALEVTEVMFNPNDDSIWEWIEVRNTDPNNDVDLLGAWGDRLGDWKMPSSYSPIVNSGNAENTIIPAGGTAVLYDAYYSSGSEYNHNDQIFRDAWGLSSSVPLVGCDYWPGLNNPLGSMGVWATYSDYELDTGPDPNDPNTDIVLSFDHALFGVDYSTGAFPTGDGVSSIQWSGTGDITDGTNWALSVSGTGGAVTSVPAYYAGAANSTLDIGNPGVTQGTATSGGIIISEIMYNPNSSEYPTSPWEWVEIYNDTGAAIDFSTTPYILSDNDTALTAENVTSGSIADGTAAILYNADLLSASDIEDAWDPNGTGVNFIPVTEFPALSNGGDTVALWDDLTTYQTDQAVPQTTGAVTALDYDDDGTIWPLDSPDGGSIYLADLSLDQTDGYNWLMSSDGDGISFFASEVLGLVLVHEGDDVGSPGTFSTSTTTPGDFDLDGDVDGADFILWQQNTSIGNLADWITNYGYSAASPAVGAVPEPASLGPVGHRPGFGCWSASARGLSRSIITSSLLESFVVSAPIGPFPPFGRWVTLATNRFTTGCYFFAHSKVAGTLQVPSAFGRRTAQFLKGFRVPLLACPAVFQMVRVLHCWTSQQWHPRLCSSPWSVWPKKLCFPQSVGRIGSSVLRAISPL